MDEIIQALDDEKAAQFLRTIAKAHGETDESVKDYDAEFWRALKAELNLQESSAPVSDGEMSRQALQLLAEDQEMRDAVGTMAKNPTTEQFMSPVLGIALTTAVIFALKSYIEIKRSPEGKWSFHFKKEPLDDSLLKGFVGRLLSWLPEGPFA